MNINLTSLKEIIIGISAFIGMILGFYNLVHSINKDKVKLIIIPKSVMGEAHNKTTGAKSLILAENDFSNVHHLFAFEIINKSKFSVIIDEIGLKIKGGNNRIVIPAPILGDKGEWPSKLGSRESIVVYAKLDNILKAFKESKVSSAYVKTNCDDVRYGSSVAFKLLRTCANNSGVVN